MANHFGQGALEHESDVTDDEQTAPSSQGEIDSKLMKEIAAFQKAAQRAGHSMEESSRLQRAS